MEMALDVESFIGQHGLERPTLIGHSMYVALAEVYIAFKC
jgi:pimeloyl-ACP methyl ester carboxylesterase